MILYRRMGEGDVPAGLALCRSTGWNQTPEDWELFLRLSPKGCCVAVDDDGEVRGTVATVRYEDHFSWIGMVMVDPAMRRQGIGIQLLREALHVLRDEDTIKLDATPAGRNIYLQLDFVDEYSLSRMEISQIDPQGLPDTTARPIETRDLSSIFWLDREVFGANREKVLNSIMKRAAQFAFVCEDNNGMKGYCFGRYGHNYSHIGPVIATDVASAKNVTAAALRNCHGRPVVMDVLLHSQEWLQWLTSLGFREQRPLLRMYRGTNSYPGKPEKQFAILGPEFG